MMKIDETETIIIFGLQIFIFLPLLRKISTVTEPAKNLQLLPGENAREGRVFQCTEAARSFEKGVRSARIFITGIQAKGARAAILLNANPDSEQAANKAIRDSLTTRHSLPAENSRETPEQPAILIVDDNKINQLVLTQMVELLGFNSAVADNGNEALKALQRDDYNVILMDCQMPELDGYETTRRIRAGKDFDPDIFIVAVTSDSAEEDRSKCLTAGMDEYLTKPVELKQLQAILQRWIPERNEHLKQTSGFRNKGSLPPPSLSPPVDMQRLLKISGGKDEELRKLLDVYLTEFNHDLSNLKTAITARLPEQIVYYAHSCAGVSAMCGVTILVPLLQKLEEAGHLKDFDFVLKLYQQVTAELITVKEFLENKGLLTLTKM